ncbi:MAG: DNA polymerase IV [Rhodospirillaceae bacterium]|nr:MAG: DNA polymerase IV [Rhodospirillaceae bacterium]
MSDAASLASVTVLCRDCLAEFPRAPNSCPRCGSNRLVSHPELGRLAIAHIDCDAFYAAIEKRDNPALADRPVLVGHDGGRGVVATACYVARRFGPRSAMPMYKALELCPDAVVIRPNMEKYKQVAAQVRAIFDAATPLVEPLSLDEAFLDLSGTAALFRRTPAATLAHIAREIEREVRITVSIGLSDTKFLAKMASDMNKPRGFTVIGRAEAVTFLHDLPVTRLPGVGPALASRLKVDGLFTIGDIQARPAMEMAARYGETGTLLANLARGLDERTVHSDRTAKTISAETTFDRDIAKVEDLLHKLWPLCERVAARLKAKGVAGRSITVKLKTARFKLLTRHHRLNAPTQLAEQIYRAAKPLVERETAAQKRQGARFRLIGVGIDDLCDASEADPPDLFADSNVDGKVHMAKVEQAMDAVRARFGTAAIGKGRGFRGQKR